MIGSAYQMRAIGKKNENLLEGALHDYLLYQNKSEYLDRMPLEDIINLTISSLTGEFNRDCQIMKQKFIMWVQCLSMMFTMF